ncbi:MAG: DoxX family protein [Acidobacteriaceae bacterium]
MWTIRPNGDKTKYEKSTDGLLSNVQECNPSLQSSFLLFIRLYWGLQFMQIGWGKLHNISGVTHYFTQLGLPFPHLTVIFIALLEFVGGILLMLGLASRLIAFPLTIDMIVAYIVGDRKALLSFFSDPGTFYVADPFTFLFVSLLVLIFGPGRFALDSLIAKQWAD